MNRASDKINCHPRGSPSSWAYDMYVKRALNRDRRHKKRRAAESS